MTGQVLTWGVPSTDRLLCDNPVCNEKAEVVATVATGVDTTKEICACKEHLKNLVLGHHVRNLVTLDIAGERNKAKEAKA